MKFHLFFSLINTNIFGSLSQYDTNTAILHINLSLVYRTLAMLVDPLQLLSGLRQGIGWGAGQPCGLRRFQLCPQLQGFLPLFKGFNAHNNQVALAVFGDINRLCFLVGKV